MSELIQEIKFIYPRSLSPYQTPDQIVKMLAQMLTNLIHFAGSAGPMKEAYEKDGGYKYQLGPTNNWWFDKTENQDEYKLVHRYGYPKNLMDALKTTILWGLGIEKFNG